MTLPASGTITMAQIATELGVALPISLNDTNVRALAGKPSGSISMTDFYGKSAASLTLTLGSTTRTRIGGVSSTTWRASRTVTPTVTGMTPTSYSWSLTSDTGMSGLTSTTGSTTRIDYTYDIDFDPGGDSGTVSLTVSDGAKSLSATISWAV